MKTNGYIIVGLAVLIVVVILQNTYTVQLHFLFWDFAILLSGLILLSFSSGILIAWLYKMITEKSPKN